MREGSLAAYQAGALLALTVLAFALRVQVLFASGRLGADEAIVGLMARHILEGERPVFYWGQSYLGAVDSYLVAGLFAAFDQHAWLLYVPALCASTALVPLCWAIAERLAPPPAGLFAALAMALPTPMFSRMLGNAGGFALGFALLFGAMWCAVRAFDQPSRRRVWTFRFTLLAGFAAWAWQPALLALLIVGGILLVQSRGQTAAAMAPVLIGIAPMVLYNLTSGYPTAAALAAKFSEQSSTISPARVLAVALGGGEETLGGVNPLQAVLFASAFVVQPIAVLLLMVRTGGREPWRTRATATAIVVLVALVSTAAAHGAARYLVPLVASAAVLTGATLALLGGSTRAGLFIALVVEIGVVAVGNLQQYPEIPDVMAGEQLSRVDEAETALSALDVRGLRTGYADYWTAYPITYLSKERIVIAPSLPLAWGKGVDRFPTYTSRVSAVEQLTQIFLLVDAHCRLGDYLDVLHATGATYQIEPVARWWLVWNIQSGVTGEGETRKALQQAIGTATLC